MAQPRHVARTINGSCFFCVCVNITTPTFVPVTIPDFSDASGNGTRNGRCRQFDHVSKVNNLLRRVDRLQCSAVIAVP